MGIYLNPGNSGFALVLTVRIPNEEVRMEFGKILEGTAAGRHRRREQEYGR